MIELKKADIPNPEYCIYRLLDSDKCVVYVGQTGKLESRIWQHVALGKEFSFFEFVECSEGEATSLEADEIIKHNPKLNTLLPKTPKYLTVGQAKKSIRRAVNKRLEKERNSFTDSLDVIFHRPKNKNMYFTYVSASQVRDIISDISKHEFIRFV